LSMLVGGFWLYEIEQAASTTKTTTTVV